MKAIEFKSPARGSDSLQKLLPSLAVRGLSIKSIQLIADIIKEVFSATFAG